MISSFPLGYVAAGEIVLVRPRTRWILRIAFIYAKLAAKAGPRTDPLLFEVAPSTQARGHRDMVQ